MSDDSQGTATDIIERKIDSLRDELKLHKRTCGTLFPEKKTPIWVTSVLSSLISGVGVVAIIWWNIQPRIERMVEKAIEPISKEIKQTYDGMLETGRRVNATEKDIAELKGMSKGARGYRATPD